MRARPAKLLVVEPPHHGADPVGPLGVARAHVVQQDVRMGDQEGRHARTNRSVTRLDALTGMSHSRNAARHCVCLRSFRAALLPAKRIDGATDRRRHG